MNEIDSAIYQTAHLLGCSSAALWGKVKEYAVTHPVSLAEVARGAHHAALTDQPLPWEVQIVYVEQSA